jgi:hypothetical protein
MKLFEGLKNNELKGLVQPIISVDEYESKIDDDGIVIAFLVDDKEPADDLVDFIEKSEFKILDSEVSPGVDDEGNYYVFVEFARNKTSIDNIEHILTDVKHITGVDEWQMRVYKKSGLHEATKENLLKLVRLRARPKQREKDIEECIRYSFVNEMVLQEDSLLMDNNQYSIVAFGGIDEKYEEYKFNYKPIRLDEDARREVKLLESLLGHNWSISKIDECLICHPTWTNKVLILQKD